MTHTLEVSQNARTIAKALRLNEELVEAIALGHDLGHTPFGHAGERALNQMCPDGFRSVCGGCHAVVCLVANVRLHFATKKTGSVHAAADSQLSILQ